MPYEFPDFGGLNHKPSGSFEARCVKQLHSVFLPGISWSKVEEACGSQVTYSEYLNHLVYEGEELPRIQFLGKSNAWKLELHDILCKDIKSYDFYKEWDQEEYDAIAFMCIGTPMVCVKSDYSLVYEISGMSISIISKARETTDYCIMRLVDYANILKSWATYNWEVA